ncbi:MAG: hypothetical protein AB4290_09900 [Spirulina sp.]
MAELTLAYVVIVVKNKTNEDIMNNKNSAAICSLPSNLNAAAICSLPSTLNASAICSLPSTRANEARPRVELTLEDPLKVLAAV